MEDQCRKTNLKLLPPSTKNEKRLDYLQWDEYFMAITFLESRKGSTKHKKETAVILNKFQIIISMASSDDLVEDENTMDNSYINHAEYKALSQIKEGVTMYTTTFPCKKCAEAIIKAGINEIVYYYDSSNKEDVEELFKDAGVTYRQFVTERKKIEIDFSQFSDDTS